MEQFTQEMLKRLDALASKLGMAGTALWGFYLRQARIEGGMEVLFGFVCLGLLLCANSWRKKFYKKYEVVRAKEVEDYGERRADGGGNGIATFLCALGMLLFLIIAISFFYYGATAIFNPGYWAFQTIVEQLKGQ